MLEILRDTNVVKADDNDVDQLVNLDEVLEGSDANSSLIMVPVNLVQFDLLDLSDHCNTRQNTISLEVQNIRLFNETLAFVDDRPFKKRGPNNRLIARGGENVLAFFYISEPDSTTLVKKEMYMEVNSTSAITL